MKKLFCIALAALMLATSLSGCGAASAAETRIEATPAATTAPYTAPERFTGEWSEPENLIRVAADADIEVPDTTAFATATVRRRTFTQEDADNLIKVFLKDSPFYQEVYYFKEDYAEIIADYEAILRGEKSYTGDGTIEGVPELIEHYKELMEKAPSRGEKPLGNSQFHKSDVPVAEVCAPYADGQNFEITGYGEVDGKKIHVIMQDGSGKYGWGGDVWIWQDGYGTTNGPCTFAPEEWYDTPEVSFPEEQALAACDALMDELGLSTFVCDGTWPVTYHGVDGLTPVYEPTGETGYMLQYVRTVNGQPITNERYDGGSSESGAAGSWYCEYIRIWVAESGVVGFKWQSPYTQPEILETDLELLPFEQIQEIFGKMIFVKNDCLLQAEKINNANGYPTDSYFDLDVNHVRLTLMRIRARDNYEEGTIIPVWDFRGTFVPRYLENDEPINEPDIHEEVLISINALDGTLVSRSLGY